MNANVVEKGLKNGVKMRVDPQLVLEDEDYTEAVMMLEVASCGKLSCDEIEGKLKSAIDAIALKSFQEGRKYEKEYNIEHMSATTFDERIHTKV